MANPETPKPSAKPQSSRIFNQTYKITNANFSDDGSVSFLWQRHTLLVIFAVLAYLIYAAVLDDHKYTTEENAKRGIGASIFMFITLGITQFNDGPFTRPHPVVWRLVLVLTVLYWLFLVFLVFQDPEDGRKFMKYIDSSLGVPIQQQTYATECQIYVPEHEFPFKNVMAKMDRFVVAHILGWFVKGLVIRDITFCNLLSIGFELIEYTFEFQLPNFGECWWDHWILDALLCNFIGLYLGVKTSKHLEMREYRWQGFFTIKGTKGKIRRAMKQFTPYSWTRFNWQARSNLKRFLTTVFLFIMMEMVELTAFFIKDVLWIPAENNLNIYRLFLVALGGAVSARELYQFCSDPECKRFGQQAWVMTFIIVTELLITYKYGEHLSKDVEWFWVYVWMAIFAVTFTWTIIQFIIRPILKSRKIKRERLESEGTESEYELSATESSSSTRMKTE